MNEWKIVAENGKFYLRNNDVSIPPNGCEHRDEAARLLATVMGTVSREVRMTLDKIELRSVENSPGCMIGYAAIFNRDSVDLGYFVERLTPGCFATALKTNDVRALFNHHPTNLLGRMSSGTLRAMEDTKGLMVEIDLPNTGLGRDVAELVKRGDISGQSFSFTTSREEWNWKADPIVRTVQEVDCLYDIGPVTFPAYADTSTAMRAISAHQMESRQIESHQEHERREQLLRLLAIS